METRGFCLSEVYVADIDVVTALGCGVEALWKGLSAGKTGIAPVRRFATDCYNSKLAGCITDLDREHPVSRLDALLEMLFDGKRTFPPDTMLLTASTKGGIDQLERFVRKQSTDLNRILGQQVANFVAGHLGLKGIRHNISAACASSTLAIALAASSIAQNDVESVLVCGLDLVSEFVFSGFSSLHALSPNACKPFDIHRDGLLLGEGAAYMLLMNERLYRQTKCQGIGQIAGWGIASDATHITAPSRTGEGLILSTRQALSRAGLKAGDIAAINAHGTGSVYNDVMELTAFGAIFDSLPPLGSIKGAIGHTMGACGAIEAIIGLCSLKNQSIPPTVGLQTPEPSTQGKVSSDVQSFLGNYLLSTNSGFGGINASIILQRIT
jgi:3-oxoacyl-[acyl-carrier-protein] synthase II